MTTSSFNALLSTQIGNEFTASQQYVAVATWFANQDLPQLARYFYRQSVEERNHAMMMVQYMLDRDIAFTIPGVPAVRNDFLRELEDRSERQVAYTSEPVGDHMAEYAVGPRKRRVWLTAHDRARVDRFEAEGFTEAMRTPDNTLIFVTPEKSREIVKDQVDCMGCLSTCRFSNWSQHAPEYSNGRKSDPRSFCIQKTLQDISHDGALEDNLMFAGHNAYRFGQDPFYSNNFVPSVKELVGRILTGR